MKTGLTIEQSQRLIELGINIDKASDSNIYDGPCHRAYMPKFKVSDKVKINNPSSCYYEVVGLIDRIIVEEYEDFTNIAYEVEVQGDVILFYETSLEICNKSIVTELREWINRIIWKSKK